MNDYRAINGPAIIHAARGKVRDGCHGCNGCSTGDPWGTIYMRKFACRYVLGVRGTRVFREAANRAQNAAEFRAAVQHFFPVGDDASGAAARADA